MVGPQPRFIKCTRCPGGRPNRGGRDGGEKAGNPRNGELGPRADRPLPKVGWETKTGGRGPRGQPSAARTGRRGGETCLTSGERSSAKNHRRSRGAVGCPGLFVPPWTDSSGLEPKGLPRA